MFKVLLAALLCSPVDAKLTDLGDGYVKAQTAAYSVELPKGWSLSSATPWGARTLKPSAGKGEMGTMTAGPTRSGWDELYRTSLYFIMREGEGKPEPYKISKTAQGYEACSFSVLDRSGFPSRRYVLLKAPSGHVLALSVKIPSMADEELLERHFQRMIRTARIEGS